ncbi:hypothetical protein LWI28_019907 [Acer negundo]|uniref:Uncharacterized protein n=1 Tax=Acer negundo TaxID=4023 RepID=A0AAD5P008_ACENE|nr:hypothetical protein LWI28_019907 [Acer negundo]
MKKEDDMATVIGQFKQKAVVDEHKVGVNNTVKRVQRDRVKGLVAAGIELVATEKVEQWTDEMEAAVWDVNVRKRLVKMNTRNDALRLVRVYLGEAWVVMGPTFLELVVARLRLLKVTERELWLLCIEKGKGINDWYDHHQKGFEKIFGHGFSTKVSSAGLVYKHFGKEIIAKELQVDEGHSDVL